MHMRNSGENSPRQALYWLFNAVLLVSSTITMGVNFASMPKTCSADAVRFGLYSQISRARCLQNLPSSKDSTFEVFLEHYLICSLYGPQYCCRLRLLPLMKILAITALHSGCSRPVSHGCMRAKFLVANSAVLSCPTETQYLCTVDVVV